MSIVKFPEINLEVSFSQIAFCLFGVPIYKYAICIVLGIIVALILCKISKYKFGIEIDEVLENFVIGLIFGVIGARLYFVLFNLNYYSQNLLEIFNLRDGGLAIYGGLIFGALGIILNCKLKKIDLLNFFDYIIPFVAIAQSIGRWGNFFNIEAYGYETQSFFRMGINTLNGYIEVHPVFLYESIATFLIFIILKILQKNRKFKGEILISYCIMYSGIRSILEGLRTDSLMFFNFRISQILSIFIFFVSIVFLYKKLKDSKKTIDKKLE